MQLQIGEFKIHNLKVMWWHTAGLQLIYSPFPHGIKDKNFITYPLLTEAGGGVLSHRRVIGLQTVGGSWWKVLRPTISTLRGTKTHDIAEGNKRSWALSIQHSLSLLLTKPAVIYSENAGLYLPQENTLMLNPQFVSSKWSGASRGDRWRRRFPPEDCACVGFFFFACQSVKLLCLYLNNIVVLLPRGLPYYESRPAVF